MTPPTAPRSRTNTSDIVVFVVVWIVIFIVALTLEMVAWFLAAFAGADSGSTRYTDPLNLVHVLFVLTQLGALLGGLYLLWRKTKLLKVAALAGILYLIWAIGWAWAFFR